LNIRSLRPGGEFLDLVGVRDDCAIKLINEGHIYKKRIHVLPKFVDRRLFEFVHAMPIVLNGYALALALHCKYQFLGVGESELD